MCQGAWSRNFECSSSHMLAQLKFAGNERTSEWSLCLLFSTLLDPHYNIHAMYKFPRRCIVDVHKALRRMECTFWISWSSIAAAMGLGSSLAYVVSVIVIQYTLTSKSERRNNIYKHTRTTNKRAHKTRMAKSNPFFRSHSVSFVISCECVRTGTNERRGQCERETYCYITTPQTSIYPLARAHTQTHETKHLTIMQHHI